MTLRQVMLSCATICGTFSFAQEGIRSDATFTPDLLLQTTAVRSVLPLPDGRVALIEFWEDAQHLFHNEMGCLHVDGTRDQTYISLSGALDLYPWNEGAFFSRQNYSGERINRHHLLNGAVDNGYHTTSMGMPGLYGFSYLMEIKMDAEARAYVLGDINLTDTANGLLGHRDIIRVDQQGGLDHSFTPAHSTYLFHALPLPDGKVVMAGRQIAYNGVPVEPLFRVNGDGSVDNNFHTTFIEARPTSVLPTPDGGMILTGQFIDFVSLIELDTLFVVKLLSDGTRDPSFNSHLRPYQNLYSDLYTTVNSIVPWGADHYLISGNFDKVDGLPKRGIAMIDADGQLETAACTWPGPGLTADGQVYISLALDGNDAVYAYGNFNGFDDGSYASATKGIVRLIRDDVGIMEKGPERPWTRLYPTPASSTAWLEWDPRDPLVSAVLCDGVGRTVRTIPIASMANTTALDLSSLPSGSYLVHVTHRSGLRSTLRSYVMP